MYRFTSLHLCLLAVVAFLCLGPSTGFSQGGLGGDLEGDILDAVDAGGGVGGGATLGSSGGSDPFAGDNPFGGTSGTTNEGPNLSDLFGSLDIGNVEIEAIPNERDTPFVGVTFGTVPEGRAEFRHVGPVRDAFGTGGQTAGGGGGGAGGFGGGGGQGGGPGAENGFSFTRPQVPIRSRIVPRFSSRPLAPTFVSSRFNQRISSLPATQQFSNSVNVTMQGRTAVITGTVRNQQQANRLQSQLRLEPGVSRIENRVRIVQ